MKQRLITSLVGLIIFFTVIYGFPKNGIIAVFCLLCALAATEVVCANKSLSASKLFVFISGIMGGFIPFFVVYQSLSKLALFALIYLVVIIVFAITNKIAFNKGRFIQSYLGVFVVTYLLSSVMKILIFAPDGKFYVLLPFAIAWLTDVFAMQGGMRIGKHKLCPKISPKKTVEGSLCGIAGGIFGAVVIGSIFKQIDISISMLIIMGFLGSVVSQLGDLSMSLVKRLNQVKDFGKIFPGHGGVLDRFDSVMLSAPFVELMLRNMGIM